MSNSKGKGKAIDNQISQTQEEQPGATQPSYIDRVIDSAKGLIQDTFSGTSNRDLNLNLTAAISNSDKASSTRNPQLGESSFSQPPSLSHQQNGVSSPVSQFRSGHTAEHVKQSESEFSDFLDNIDTFQPSALSKESFPTNFDSAWSKTGQSAISTDGLRTFAEQERRDGEDVVNLLSRPQEEEPLGQSEDDEEYLDWGLDRDQIAQIQTITRELFPPFEPHGDLEKIDSRNLTLQPDVTMAVALTGSESLDQSRLEQWEGVLTRYTDEVWGGLLPLVKEARHEVEGLKSDTATKELPDAVRRLQAILGHLQKR